MVIYNKNSIHNKTPTYSIDFIFLSNKFTRLMCGVNGCGLRGLIKKV